MHFNEQWDVQKRERDTFENTCLVETFWVWKKYVGYSGRVSEHSNSGQDLRGIRMVIMTLGIVSILVKVEYCG